MRVRVLGVASVVCALATAAWAGPVSPYYLTAGDELTNWIVQGSSVVTSWDQHQTNGGQGEYAIAVSEYVRTLGNGNETNFPGSEYTLAGAYTGVDIAGVGIAGFYDGTTDGTHIYSASYSDGYVYQFDAYWQNAVQMFSVGVTPLGITYDGADGTLWVAEYGSLIQHFAMDGTLLGSFGTDIALITSLALDPADGTLWMGNQDNLGTFYQYSRGGVLLSTEYYEALSDQNTLGGEGEFGSGAGPGVPEPASFTLVGIALAGLGMLLRRRRPA